VKSEKHINSTPAHGDDPHSDAPPARRQRNGNVARLPKEIRQKVNEMLDDGLTYREIVQELKALGYHLAREHIRRWKQGGYQDHLREQRLLALCLLRQERALQMISGANPINAFQATQQISASQICAVITEMGPDILREALLANPLNYFRTINSFARLTTGGLKCEKHLIEESERLQAEALKKLPNHKKGISDESIQEMQGKLNLM